MSTHCPSVLAEVAVYPAQVAATICDSFLLAAELSTRDPPWRGLISAVTTTSRKSMVSLQHRAQALCRLALNYDILLLHQTSLHISVKSSHGSSPLCTSPDMCCITTW